MLVNVIVKRELVAEVVMGTMVGRVVVLIGEMMVVLRLAEVIGIADEVMLKRGRLDVPLKNGALV